MKKLYDLGYQTIKEPRGFLEAIAALEAVVIDTRFNPHSRNPAWNKITLQRKLIERYVHVQELGNVNYQEWSAEIQIKDLEAGLRYIEHHLLTNNVILLCACKDRNSCHRKVIANACEQHLGLVSIPLDNDTCTRLASGLPIDPQLKLF